MFNMLRVTRETDYGILLLTCFARFWDQSVLTTRDVSQETGVPYRMTCKILNLLVRKRLLQSQRGVSGGYTLSRQPEEITLSDMISALEGPIALTDCSKEKCDCELEENCNTRIHWQLINKAFEESLAKITLSSLAKPPQGLPTMKVLQN